MAGIAIELECFMGRGVSWLAKKYKGTWIRSWDSSLVHHNPQLTPVEWKNDPKQLMRMDCLEDMVLDFVGDLNTCDAHVNASCGLHVHLDRGQFTRRDLSLIAVNYAFAQDIIYSWFDPSRQQSTYCERITVQTSPFVPVFGGKMSALHVHHKFPTLEFRQHEGTVDPMRIIMWIRFIERLSFQSQKYGIGFPQLTHNEDGVQRLFDFIDDPEVYDFYLNYEHAPSCTFPIPLVDEHEIYT